MNETGMSELVIGFTQTCGLQRLHLLFDTYQEACDAAGAIENGGARRVTVETAEGCAVIWTNYVTWVRVLRFAAPAPAENG